jgi:peptidoglycan biosynthesis protein MviN/MurJ (putative lipid II flippase)
MVLSAVANVCATAAAAPVFGYYGVVAATGVAISAASIAFGVHFLRAYRLDRARSWHAIRPPVLLAVGLAAPIGVLTALWPIPGDRWHALPPLAVTGVTYLAVYWLIASHLRLLPERLSLRGWRNGRRSARAAS